jgi:hypothetical protein
MLAECRDIFVDQTLKSGSASQELSIIYHPHCEEEPFPTPTTIQADLSTLFVYGLTTVARIGMGIYITFDFEDMHD